MFPQIQTAQPPQPSMTLTANERAWIDFLRLIAEDRDPAPTLRAVQALRQELLARPGNVRPGEGRGIPGGEVDVR